MSLLYGLIYTDDRPVPPEMKERMASCLNKYKLDSINFFSTRQGIFCCGKQEVTPESAEETLPYFDKEHNLVIAADAIIDNRKELFRLLGIPDEKKTNTADSELILLAYLKWKEECPRYLIGDYSFVIWNGEKNELFGARDHVGKRTFYYSQTGGCFAFCTAMAPILHLGICSKDLNDNWIADYLSLSSLIHEIDCTSTVYKNIRQLLPGHSIMQNFNRMKITRYWDPTCKPELKLKNNAEYEEAFREVFFEAVDCRLRSAGSTGILLSGGLDSASVAAVAAKILKEANKTLHAYSFVPFPGYKDWLPRHLVANEEQYILALSKQYDNIDLSFLHFEDLNAISNVHNLLDMMEQPYKITANLYWIEKMTEEAYKSGCRVLLDGQHGNCSVSAGGLIDYLLALLRTGRFIGLAREVKNYSEMHHVDYSKVMRYFIRYATPDFLKSLYRFILYKNSRKTDEHSLIPVNQEYAERFHASRRLKKYNQGKYEKKQDMYDIKKQMNDTISLSHVACIETKLSLKHGIAKRDPTRDKRVIEFCMRLPISQFVNNGQERSLIRRSLEGLLPDIIRLNYQKRGQQSADFVQRLYKDWNKITDELRSLTADSAFSQYIDSRNILKVINDVGIYPKDQEYLQVQLLLNCLVFGKFIFNERRYDQ